MAEQDLFMFLKIDSNEQAGWVVGICLCFPPFYTSEIYSPHHQSLVPASLHNYAKEQRKLCQSILSWTLRSNLNLNHCLYISLPVHNLEWLPISTELNINFLVFHLRHILASASLSHLIACNYVLYKMNHLSFPGSHFLRPWFVCIVCSA